MRSKENAAYSSCRYSILYVRLDRERAADIHTARTTRIRVLRDDHSARSAKMVRSMLRDIRVASKRELIDRIHLYFEQINAEPGDHGIFHWKYKIDETSMG